MRVWILGGTVTSGAFTNANEESSAAAVEGLGHVVTRRASTGISAAPTRDDCDAVIHLSGTTALSTALRGTVDDAAGILAMNADYVQNVNGGIALASGSPASFSNTSITINNVSTIDFTDGYAVSDVVAISGSALTLRRVNSGFVAGAQIWSTGAGGVFHYVGYTLASGSTNLAGATTTARLATLLYDAQIGSFNAAGLQILDDLLTWLSAPITVTAFGPQVLWTGRESTIQGTGFGATQGSGQLTINIAGNRTAVQTIDAWSDTEITFTTVFDDTVNEPIQAFPDEVAVKVENQWGSESVFLGLAVSGPEMHYHGVVQTGIHLAFGSGPRQFSNLPDNVLWTDITSKVRGFNYSRGRQHELGQVQAGTATIVLSNNDGAFNEHNTQSPYYPFIRPLLPVRIVAAVITDIDGGVNSWEFHRLWSGYVESWPVSFPNRADSVVTITCSDLFKALALARYGARSWESLLTPDTGGPIAWWRFSGATGDVDETGNGHTLTWNGNPVFERPGAWSVDEAVTLDGTGDFATVASDNALEILDDSTIEFWFKPDGTEPAEGECIISSTGITDLYEIVYKDSSLVFYPTTANGQGAFIAFERFTDDQWHHVMITMEWNSGRTVTCYVDGVLESQATWAYEPPAQTRAHRIGSFDGSTGFYSGSLSELVLWDRVLTAAEASEHYDAGFEAFPVEATDVRVQRILDLFIESTDAALTVRDEGRTDIQSRTAAGATLGEIQTTVNTESGLFFIDGEGIPTFEGRHYRLLNEVSPRATFGPADDEYTYQELVLSYDDSELDNLIRVTPGDGEPTAVAIDTSSVDTYGPRVREITIYPDDRNEALSLAAFLLALRAAPSTRVRSITFKMGADPALWDVVLGADLSHRFRVKKAMIGDDFSQGVYVEAISMSVGSSKEWTVTWQLSPAITQSFWVLGQEDFSELGETTNLGY